MNAIVLLTVRETSQITPATEYWAGAAIALLILGYLLYTLIKPEKF